MKAEYLDLYDYRLRVAAMYRQRNQSLAAGQDPEDVLRRFRGERDHLFADHPQSALDPEQLLAFRGVSYFPYNPDARVEAMLIPDAGAEAQEIGTSGPELMPMRPAGSVDFELGGEQHTLPVFWIDVYGGGLFLPFRDATAPVETYGGGRYLFDTVKGSDFEIVGREAEALRIILDFNYAYNPSCAYNPHWVCPLAPPDSHLPVPVEAGEKRFHH